MARKLVGRKLLAASIGVATVSYVAACGTSHPVGNLGPVPGSDAGAPDATPNLFYDGPVGNLGPADVMSFPDVLEAGTPDVATDAPEEDAATDAEAADASTSDGTTDDDAADAGGGD